MTLSQLGEKCSLATSTISKIEQNQISPTYENILRLADGLQVDVAQLFSREQATMATGRRSLTRAGQGAKLASPHYEYEMLCSELSRKQFIPLLTTIRARSLAEFPDFIRHEGEEFVFVLSGELDLMTEHYEPLRLNTGDSCYFDSTMGHAVLSAGEQDAVVLWVCSRVTLPTNGNAPDAPPAGQVRQLTAKRAQEPQTAR
jgi:transcriptional regulator with XRE-family HTH domain